MTNNEKPVGSPSALQFYRGKLIGEWLRAAMQHPATGISLSNADVARLIGRSPTYVGILVNDCFAASDHRVKLPSDDVIEKIAVALGADAADGRARRYAQLNRYRDPNAPTEQTEHSDPSATVEGDDIVLENGRRYRIRARLGDPSRPLVITPEVATILDGLSRLQEGADKPG